MEAGLRIIEERLEGLLERLAAHQRGRVMALATEINPRLTSDDLLQPDDYPELRKSPEWNYEDGVLAGLLMAQVALRAELRRLQDE